MTGKHRTSTGHDWSGTRWLDLHFEANRPEYESALRMVEFPRNGTIVDAGCGAGNYVPGLADAIGATGRIIALDLAPENIETVQQRLAQEWDLATPVETMVGSVLDLPFDDASVDGIWCANVQQYMPDTELDQMIGEFRRTLRPGGICAIKDYDFGVVTWHPGDPALSWRLLTHGLESPEWNVIKGVFRAVALHDQLKDAGFTDVWQRSLLIEYRAPLTEVQRQFLKQFFASRAQAALSRDLPREDLAFWRTVADPGQSNHLVDDPRFYHREGMQLAVGRVPVP